MSDGVRTAMAAPTGSRPIGDRPLELAIGGRR
jgi:hypothetical protein